MVDSTIVSPGIKTPKCGVGFVPIFERYLIATANRPYAVDTPKTLCHNGLAPSPGSAQKTARRLAAHLLAAAGSQRCSAGWLPTIRRRSSPLPLACCVAGRSFGLAPTGPSHREVLARLHRQGSTPAAVDFAALRQAERRAGYRAAKAPRAGGPSSTRPGLPQPRSAPRAPCPWPPNHGGDELACARHMPRHDLWLLAVLFTEMGVGIAFANGLFGKPTAMK